MRIISDYARASISERLARSRREAAGGVPERRLRRARHPLSRVSSARYRLRKRLRRVEDLPLEDQKTVLKVVDALIETRNARKVS